MPKIDPALYEQIQEIAEIAREIGAGRCLVVRGAKQATLTLDMMDTAKLKTLLTEKATIGISSTLPILAGGTVLILEFPASDGGEQPIEIL